MQVLFRQCQRCCYPETVHTLHTLLNENLCVIVFSGPVNSVAPSTASIGAHPTNHTDASFWALLLLDARSEFSTSINHRVPNGRLPFGMRPIAEGAAVEAVAEAALIA